MAAIIHPPHPLAPQRPAPRPHLVVIEGGPEAALRRRRSAAVYRRRRLAAAALVVAVAVAAISLVQQLLPAGATEAAVPTVAPAAVATPGSAVVVQPGDSLWTVARRLQPTGDVRGLVDRLAEANGGTVLHVGQRLVVPAP